MTLMSNPTGRHRPKRRHHGEGSVVKRTDRWRARPWAAVVPYIDPSGRRRQMWLSAASREEADELRKAELRRLRSRVVYTDHTVGSYVVAWLQTADLSPSAYDRYRQHVQERILPSLGALPLDGLTPPKVRAAMNTWSGAPATRHGTLIVLRMAMRQAMTDRMLDADAMAGIKAPTVRHSSPTVLDVDDARKLMATVKGDRYAPLLAVSLGLGLRRGEALALRTSDINWEDFDGDSGHPVGERGRAGRRGGVEPGLAPVRLDTPDQREGADAAGPAGRDVQAHRRRAVSVTVRYSLRRIPVSTRVDDGEWWRLQQPKADSGRTIPLPRFVADALAERIAERDVEAKAAKVYAYNDFIFCDVRGNPVAFSTLQNWFERSLKKAGLPHIRWHALRGTTATMLLAEGVPEIFVMQIMGHSDLQMTRRYVKLLPRVSRDAADRMEGALG